MQILDLTVSLYYDHPNKNELAKLSNFSVRKELGEYYFVEGKKGRRIYKAQGTLLEGNVDWLIEHADAAVYAQDFENGFFVRLTDKVKVSYDKQTKLVSILARHCQIGTFVTPPTNL